MEWSVSEQHAEPLRLAALRQRVTFGSDDLGAIIGAQYEALYGGLPPNSPTGKNVIAYVPIGDRSADMLVGFMWAGALPEGLEVVELPGGAAAHTQHVGAYAGLPAAHQAVHAWLRTQGQHEVGLNWEVYGDWSDDPAQLVTDVYYARLR